MAIVSYQHKWKALLPSPLPRNAMFQECIYRESQLNRGRSDSILRLFGERNRCRQSKQLDVLQQTQPYREPKTCASTA
jgi:hypothetical protein